MIIKYSRFGLPFYFSFLFSFPFSLPRDVLACAIDALGAFVHALDYT